MWCLGKFQIYLSFVMGGNCRDVVLCSVTHPKYIHGLVVNVEVVDSRSRVKRVKNAQVSETHTLALYTRTLFSRQAVVRNEMRPCESQVGEEWKKEPL